ncbi:hypothetical protein P7C71_g884, partial [Lecanoromycetidae sp. Uapishka_2]
MFVEPDAAESKVAHKADPTAPARSAIRRQRTVRYSPNVRDHQSTLSTLLSRNQSRSQGRMRMLADRRTLLEDIRRRDQSTAPSASNRDEVRDTEAEADFAHSEASQRSRLESGRALLRDALSYERPGRRMRIARENTISDETPASQAVRPADVTRSPPLGHMPTPPYTSGETSNGSSPQISNPSIGAASLTPRFAPAHRLDADDEARANNEREEVLSRLAARMAEMSDSGEREYVAGHRAEINRMRARNPAELSLEYREAEAAYLESVETRLDLMRRTRSHDIAELPPLQRMRGPIRDIVHTTHPQSRVDGLGDRERSFSPENDHWETMLTTIQPDERVPSAHSSFTTASASSLSSNSDSSYGTLVTAPSTSADVDVCPNDFADSDDEPIDIIGSQLAQAESQARRIEALSQQLSRGHTREDDYPRFRRLLERETELHEMEANLRRLERQISEEQPHFAGRRRREERRRPGRERL